MVTGRTWRGIGFIPESGLEMNDDFREFDANFKFNLNPESEEPENECIAGEILKGLKKPKECPHFGELCVPENPLGAPMVSSEGACAAYYNYSQ